MTKTRKPTTPQTRTRARRKVQKVGLAQRRKLAITRGPSAELVQLLDADQAAAISIRIVGDTIDLFVHGANLRLQATGSLSLEASHLSLVGREGLTLASGGDANVNVAGNLQSTARQQALVATLGEVRVTANDDVRLDGERILLNT